METLIVQKRTCGGWDVKLTQNRRDAASKFEKEARSHSLLPLPSYLQSDAAKCCEHIAYSLRGCEVAEGKQSAMINKSLFVPKDMALRSGEIAVPFVTRLVINSGSFFWALGMRQVPKICCDRRGTLGRHKVHLVASIEAQELVSGSVHFAKATDGTWNLCWHAFWLTIINK